MSVYNAPEAWMSSVLAEGSCIAIREPFYKVTQRLSCAVICSSLGTCRCVSSPVNTRLTLAVLRDLQVAKDGSLMVRADSPADVQSIAALPTRGSAGDGTRTSKSAQGGSAAAPAPESAAAAAPGRSQAASGAAADVGERLHSEGNQLFAAGEWAAAARRYKEALAVHPSLTLLQACLLNCAVADRTRQPQGTLCWANAALRLGASDKGKRLCAQALETERGADEVATGLGQPAAVRAMCAQVATANSSAEAASGTAAAAGAAAAVTEPEALKQAGNAAFELKDVDTAQRHWLRAAAACAGKAPAQLANLAACHLQLGAHNEAARDAAAALCLGPAASVAVKAFFRGATALTALGHFDAAEAMVSARWHCKAVRGHWARWGRKQTDVVVTSVGCIFGPRCANKTRAACLSARCSARWGSAAPATARSAPASTLCATCKCVWGQHVSQLPPASQR